jgi:hypothetical protein
VSIIELTPFSFVGILMSLHRPHRFGKAWPAFRWSWLAPALALMGMLLPVTGWSASAQLQNLWVAGNPSGDGENEFPGGDEGDDADDGDLEAHLLYRRTPRESLPPGVDAGTSAPLWMDGDTACTPRALHSDRPAAACSAARLPLRC